MGARRIVAILFADLVGSSSIQRDELKRKLHHFFNKEVVDQLFNDSNHFYHNTWGDGLIACSDNPTELAEIALQLRDRVANTDWHRFGLSQPMQVRIGLHSQLAEVITDANGITTNVVGKGVDKAARIEPITEPNRVFCSDTFHRLLSDDNVQNIVGVSVGRKRLAKNYGEMDLYVLEWSGGQTIQPTPVVAEVPAPPMPNVKRKLTDKDRADFLIQTFDTIRKYFRNALDYLSKTQVAVEGVLRPITTTRFVCEVYWAGQLKNSCRIWIGGRQFGADGINYFEGRSVSDEDSPINETLQINDDGSELFLDSVFGAFTGSPPSRMSPTQAAEHFWLRFIRPLEH